VGNISKLFFGTSRILACGTANGVRAICFRLLASANAAIDTNNLYFTRGAETGVNILNKKNIYSNLRLASNWSLAG